MLNLQDIINNLETISIEEIQKIINELIHSSNMLLLNNNNHVQNTIKLARQIKQLIPLRDEYNRLKRMKFVSNEKLSEIEQQMRKTCLECLQNNKYNF
jgi:hypothetical protein